MNKFSFDLSGNWTHFSSFLWYLRLSGYMYMVTTYMCVDGTVFFLTHFLPIKRRKKNSIVH